MARLVRGVVRIATGRTSCANTMRAASRPGSRVECRVTGMVRCVVVLLVTE
jgi:hypothetical protein